VVREYVEALRLRDAEEVQVALTLRHGANQTRPSSFRQNNRCSCPNNRLQNPVLAAPSFVSNAARLPILSLVRKRWASLGFIRDWHSEDCLQLTPTYPILSCLHRSRFVPRVCTRFETDLHYALQWHGDLTDRWAHWPSVARSPSE
jgi:hypothetical protein